MTERLIDAVCPHCGRVGTTVRVVLQEDGHTKLSRRWINCGGEWIQTFDQRDYAWAEVEKQRAENERQREEIARLRKAMTNMMIGWRHIRSEREEYRAEVERQRAEIERLRDEDTKTRHALKGWVFVCPDGGDEPTHERVAAVVAEVARMKKLHAPPADLPWPSREEGKP